MLRVVVSVALWGEDDTRDLEVPAEVPVSDLSKLVAKALGWNLKCEYEVFVESRGVAIPPDQSLSDASVWTGTLLLFKEHCESGSEADLSSDNLAWLKVEESGHRYPLPGREVWVGRKSAFKSESSLPLVDLGNERLGKTVSRRHVKMVLLKNQWVVEVGNAKNATLLNGTKLEVGKRYVIAGGDRLQLGGVVLRFLTNLYKEGDSS